MYMYMHTNILTRPNICIYIYIYIYIYTYMCMCVCVYIYIYIYIYIYNIMYIQIYVYVMTINDSGAYRRVSRSTTHDYPAKWRDSDPVIAFSWQGLVRSICHKHSHLSNGLRSSRSIFAKSFNKSHFYYKHKHNIDTYIHKCTNSIHVDIDTMTVIHA
jgi:hypothetical protein